MHIIRVPVCLSILVAAGACSVGFDAPEVVDDPNVAKTTEPIISDTLLGLDLEAPGPYAVTSSEYDLGASLDPLVLGRVTDVRGVIHMPSGSGPYPLVVLLHGNHDTCRAPVGPPYNDSSNAFAETGQCDRGLVEVPSHRGFDYLGTQLASHGYAVVSINANRGIGGLGLPPGDTSGDAYLILARGRLVLKHLAQLYAVSRPNAAPNAGVGVDVRGKLDFANVGLMGHSRGGEGVRAALHLYRTGDPQSYASQIPGLSVKAVFEFAPVDLSLSLPGTSPTAPLPLDADGAHWTVVIPSCDRDVSGFLGVGPFSRRRAEVSATQSLFSSVFVIPGANHNFFNSEWTFVDGIMAPNPCPTDYTYIWDPQWDPTPAKFFATFGSEPQRRMGIMTFSAFFRGFLGHYPQRETHQKVFDPQFRVPAKMSALVEPARESLWHDLSEVTTQLATSRGSVGTSYQEAVLLEPLTGYERRLTNIRWSTASTANYYDAQLWANGRSLNGAWILSSSLARYQPAAGDPLQDVPLDLGVRLLYTDGTASPAVRLTTYVKLTDRINELPTCEEAGGVTVDAAHCRMSNVLDSACSGTFAPYANDPTHGDCTQLRESRFLLFYEVPIEIKDFASTAADKTPFTKTVKGIRFTFDGTAQGQVFLDRTFVLRLPFKGDVNADGKIDIVDALSIANYYVGTPLVPFNLRAADVDCNGTVDIVDALTVSQYYVGQRAELPCAH